MKNRERVRVFVQCRSPFLALTALERAVLTFTTRTEPNSVGKNPGTVGNLSRITTLRSIQVSPRLSFFFLLSTLIGFCYNRLNDMIFKLG